MSELGLDVHRSIHAAAVMKCKRNENEHTAGCLERLTARSNSAVLVGHPTKLASCSDAPRQEVMVKPPMCFTPGMKKSTHCLRRVGKA